MTLPWNRPKAILLLEDGTVFRGYTFCGHGRTLGEVVFNTSMTGYQEVLTDPSYKGQIVAMTYPLTGTYGINPEDMESAAIHVEAFIVKEYQDFASNWRSNRSLADFLTEYGKIGIEGIDTRALTRHLRVRGAMRGIVATDTDNLSELMDQVQAYPGLNGIDLVKYVTCQKPYSWHDGRRHETNSTTWLSNADGFRVAALDCGIKYNILRKLEKAGCQVMVFPAHTGASHILSSNPDGIFLSNGPGRPGRRTLCHRNRSKSFRKKADIRHLPRTPDDGTCAWGQHIQTQVRAQGRESAGKGPHDRPNRDHLPRITVSASIRVPFRTCLSGSRI